MAGNRKQTTRNPIGGSHGWTKERDSRAHSQKAGNLAGYVTGVANDPKEEEDEENAAGNCKQLARDPVWGSHGCGNENAPTSDPSLWGFPEERREDLQNRRLRFQKRAIHLVQ